MNWEKFLLKFLILAWVACLGIKLYTIGRTVGRMDQKMQDDAKLQQCNKIVWGGGR